MLSPITWLFCLIVFSLYVKNEKLSKKLRIWSLVVLYLCCNSFIVDELFRAYEPVTPDYEVTNQKFDGAIILGGIGDIDLRLQKINFGASADRLFQILPLLHKGQIKRIVFTGGSGKIEFPEKKEAFYVKKYLNQIGVPDSQIVIESESRNTYENAIFTKKIMDSLKLKGNYLLVTSAYHMPRSMAIFKKAGYTHIYPCITNKKSGIRRFTFDHLFIPNSDALFGFQLITHEWFGYFIYKLNGYA